MAKKILLLLGHPSQRSFCNALLQAYCIGAESAGAIVKTLYISDMDFDVNLADGYTTGKADEPEPALLEAQELIRWAGHIVLAFPNWWGGMPAITKGFIDRILLPGFAFKHHSGKNFPDQLLKGKSMRILVTMDTPKLWFYLVHRASLYLILKKVVFGYVGFKPLSFSTFGFMRKSTEKKRRQWLQQVTRLGNQFK